MSMILRDLQAYITEHQRVSLAQLTLRFRMDADALRPMLKRLEQKGRVQKLDASNSCHKGGCHGCDVTTMEFYEWTSV